MLPDFRPAENSALILVDLQRGFVVRGDNHWVPERVASFLDQHFESFSRVVALKFINGPESRFYRRGWTGMVDPEEQRLVPELDPYLDRITVIEKSGYAPGREIEPALTEGQVVYLAGFETDQCLLATALSLDDRGYGVRVLLPLCGSTGGRENERAGRLVLRRALGSGAIIDRF